MLLAGPPLAGPDEFLLETILGDRGRGSGGLVIATRHDGRSVLSNYRRGPAGDRSGRVGVVECVSDGPDDRVERNGVCVCSASSPGDLTGIGIRTSELLDEFPTSAGVPVGVDSLSTLLLYSEFERTCRFLHVLSGRVARAGGIGLFVVNPGAVGSSQYDQLKTLFDGVVELRKRERERDREIRIRGLSGVEAGWRSVD